MKRAVLIHGWEGVPEEGWRPWLRQELEKKGFTVFVPAMPDTEHPVMDKWVGKLAEVVGTSDKELFLVGHSLGNITILRFLETLEKDQEIGGAVLVAGFSDNLGFKELDSFFTKPVDWDKINSHCKKFIAINSDNDKYVPLKHGDIFKEKIGAEVIVKHNMGHIGVDDNVTELPDVLESVLKIS